MTVPPLQHLTVVIIAVGSTLVAIIYPDTIDKTYIIWGVILGYVFKNGKAVYRNGKP